LVAIEIDSTISIPQTKAEAFMHPTLLRVITHAKAFIVLQIELFAYNTIALILSLHVY
jgi:hypothetical protein